MSAFSQTQAGRLAKLMELSKLLLETGNAHSFVAENKDFIPTVIPSDFIALFDRVVLDGYAMEDIKVLTNKLLNIFNATIRDYKRTAPKVDSFLGLLEQNNRQMELLLDKIRPVFKGFVKEADNVHLRKELLSLFIELESFVQHYTIKENVLFPLFEENGSDYRCVQIMWSFHDDIRQNIKTVLAQLCEDSIDLKLFNQCVGDIFFNMLAIKFREEHILFPHICSTISESQLEAMNSAAAELGYPYVQPALDSTKQDQSGFDGHLVNLGTGAVSVEQIKLIFNHLPIDITFVDEHNKVRYFSAPTKRIFPRTTAVIGRDVSNCHPPESVHVVEKIVESFRNGEQERAAFWIKMKGIVVFIQYFAVRSEKGIYKGVLEVSQEISEIQSLEGEKRLLDW